MGGGELIPVLLDAASVVRHRLDNLDYWGPVGAVDGQHACDLAADEAAREVLEQAGLAVLSEESGLHDADREILVVLDPVDGSTNAWHRLPWWATSVCALDPEGPLAAVVVNQATGETFSAVRGGGAFANGRPIKPSGCASLSDAVVALSGYPPRHLGWAQFRSLGATALDLCAVASGSLDAYLECSGVGQAAWDYLGGMLVCQEAGAFVSEAFGHDLVQAERLRAGEPERRAIVAAASGGLLADLLTATAARAG